MIYILIIYVLKNKCLKPLVVYNIVNIPSISNDLIQTSLIRMNYNSISIPTTNISAWEISQKYC